MFRRLLGVAGLLAFAAHAAAQASDEATVESRDVCIIGAGPAGIGAALALAKKQNATGVSFALLEREALVGGQSTPEYRDPVTGFRIHMGAVFFTPRDYELTVQLAKSVGLGVETWAPAGHAVAAGYIPSEGAQTIKLIEANFTARSVLLSEMVKTIPNLAAAFRRFETIHDGMRPVLLNSGGMPYILEQRPELAANLDAWLRDNDLQQLAVIFAGAAMQTGYGHSYQSSAASFLQYLTPYTLVSSMGAFGIDTSKMISLKGRTDSSGTVWPTGLYTFQDDVGFAEVLQRAAAQKLPAGSVRVNVSITSFIRPPAGQAGPVAITYTQNGEEHSLQCGAVINTVGQVLPSLSFMDLDAEERSLFSAVKSLSYYTTALAVDPPFREPGVYSFPLPPDSGVYRRMTSSWPRGSNPNNTFVDVPADVGYSAIVDPFPYIATPTELFTLNVGSSNRLAGTAYKASLGTVYSYSDIPVTLEEVAAAAVRIVNGTTRRAEARKTYSHVYYCHVDEAALRGGFFKRLNQMQGRRQTWHAGGLLTFWDVEMALKSGMDVIANYF